jgi:hypothetical protein
VPAVVTIAMITNLVNSGDHRGLGDPAERHAEQARSPEEQSNVHSRYRSPELWRTQ